MHLNLAAVCSFIFFCMAACCGDLLARSSPDLESEPVSVELDPEFSRERMRPWTVETSVNVRYVVGQQAHPGSWILPINPIIVSHDKGAFFFVTRHGDIKKDCNEYRLHVFFTKSVRNKITNSEELNKPLTPNSSVAMCSKTNESAMQGAHWDESGKAIVFLGVDIEDNSRGVFRFNVIANDLERLTPPEADITQYAVRGNTMIYEMVDQVEVSKNSSKYPAQAILAGEQLRDLLYPRRFVPDYSLRVRHNSNDHILVAHRGSGYFGGPWISPDGQYAIVVSGPSKKFPVPGRWSGYEPPSSYPWLLRLAPRFFLIDTAESGISAILDAPTGHLVPSGAFVNRRTENITRYVRPKALWSADARSVVLVNTALPLSYALPERAKMAYIVSLDPREGRKEVLEPLESNDYEAYDVGWLAEGIEFVVVKRKRNGQRIAGTAYKWNGTRWKSRQVPSSVVPLSVVVGSESADEIELPVVRMLPGGVSVSVSEDANNAPMVYAKRGSVSVPLLSPDPSLENVYISHVEAVEWTEAKGRIGRGLLVMPAQQSASRIPLVIQAVHEEPAPERFLPDGPHSSAFASQALAARGIAVLQVAIASGFEGMGYPEERDFFVNRVDSAVKHLAQHRRVDSNRVGLIGFSRTGYNVHQLISHPGSVVPAAAVIAEAFAGTFGFYLRDILVSSYGGEEQERMYGGGTFWENKSGWLEHSPIFNADKICTPTLFGEVGTSLTEKMIEILASYRSNHRPIEFLLFPDPVHGLIRPRAREESLTATVDWMDFWLNGQVNSDPVRAERNGRWQGMRQDWLKNRAREGCQEMP